ICPGTPRDDGFPPALRLQDAPHVVEVRPDCGDRRLEAGSPLFDDARNRPSVVANRPQNLGHVEIALADVCRSAVAFLITNVQVSDAIVVRLDVLERVVSAADIMADVEIDHELLRQCEHAPTTFIARGMSASGSIDNAGSASRVSNNDAFAAAMPMNATFDRHTALLKYRCGCMIRNSNPVTA